MQWLERGLQWDLPARQLVPYQMGRIPARFCGFRKLYFLKLTCMRLQFNSECGPAENCFLKVSVLSQQAVPSMALLFLVYNMAAPPFSGISFRQFKKTVLFCPRVTWAVERARGVCESFRWIETIRFMKGFLNWLHFGGREGLDQVWFLALLSKSIFPLEH